ncbi:hypothetical protein MUP38_06350 [Candidatus Bathyarchaeota archaeon]|nr:hypothetical protein [Candidatus Bathyarchaeota archaeon]
MRLLKDNKGQIRVIEAFFASVLLLSSLTLIPIMQRSQSNDVTDVLSSTALNVLMSLDSDGHLANLADSQNWTAIHSVVQSCLPLTVWFNLTVFDQNMAPVNDALVCSGGLVSDKIHSAEYVCASTSRNYAVYSIRLHLAAVD